MLYAQGCGALRRELQTGKATRRIRMRTECASGLVDVSGQAVCSHEQSARWVLQFVAGMLRGFAVGALPRVRDEQAMSQGGTIETGIFWPGPVGAAGLRGGPAELGYMVIGSVMVRSMILTCRGPGRRRRVQSGSGGRRWPGVSSGLHQLLSGLADGSGCGWRQSVGVAS